MQLQQKRCSIVPVSVVIAACNVYGRCEQTVSLLQSVGELPRLWALSLEQEQNRARLEEDLVLNDEIAGAEEHEPSHLAAELAVMVPFASNKGDDEALSSSWSLARVPDSLAREFVSFVKYRQDALNIHRQGSAVVPITCENDKGTCLRFLGYLSAEKDIQPGFGVFAKMDLSQWVSDWINALKGKGLMFSSLAVSPPPWCGCVHDCLCSDLPKSSLCVPLLAELHKQPDIDHILCLQHIQGR